MLDTAGAHGNTSCSAGRTTASTKTQSILRCGTAAGRKPGRAAKEAEGRRQTEGIIVHTHSCGLPRSINTSPTHDSIVRAAQSLHWRHRVHTPFRIPFCRSHTAHTHIHTFFYWQHFYSEKKKRVFFLKVQTFTPSEGAAPDSERCLSRGFGFFF